MTTLTGIADIVRGEMIAGVDMSERSGSRASGDGDADPAGEDSEGQSNAPDYKTQKTEIHAALQQRLKQGDIWYVLVDK